MRYGNGPGDLLGVSDIYFAVNLRESFEFPVSSFEQNPKLLFKKFSKIYKRPSLRILDAG